MSPLREYERLLLELHELFCAGKHDSPEADAIREEMDGPCSKLFSSELQQIADLSGDLYILEGSYYPPLGDPEPHLPLRERASRLAHHWRSLGFEAAAKRFEAFSRTGK